MTSISVFAEYFPPYMGSDLRIFELSKSLASKGYDVSFLVTPAPRVLAGIGEFHAPQRVTKTPSKLKVDNLTGHYIRLPSAVGRAWQRYASLVLLPTILILLIQAIRKIAQLRPKLVIVAHPSFLCGVVGYLAARIMRRKVIMDYPDLWAPLVKETLGLKDGQFKVALIQAVEHLLVRNADFLTVASTPIYNVARRMGARRVAVIPNGVDLTHFNNRTTDVPLADRSAKIVYVGRFEYWAGLDILIDSAPLVLNQIPSAEFLLVGDGSCKQDLVDRVNRKGLGASVRIVGPVPHADVPKFISTAEIGVIPFNGNVAAQVALPVKVFEYMAMGKPVVASDTPAMRDVVVSGWNGVLVKPHSETDLAQGIIKLLANKSYAGILAVHALDDIRSKFSWSNISTELASVVRELA